MQVEICVIKKTTFDTDIDKQEIDDVITNTLKILKWTNEFFWFNIWIVW